MREKKNERKEKKNKATNHFTTGVINVHTDAIQCVQTEMSLGAAVILTNLGDWKDIFGSYYVALFWINDVKWISVSHESNERKVGKITQINDNERVFVCVWAKC